MDRIQLRTGFRWGGEREEKLHYHTRPEKKAQKWSIADMPQTKLNRCVFSGVQIEALHSGTRMVVFQFATFLWF